MPKARCVPCISEDLKKIIRANTNNMVLHDSLATIPSCEDSLTINFCQKGKRAPSKYQLFIKDCLAKKPIKGKPFGAAGQFMKECALEYKKQQR